MTSLDRYSLSGYSLVSVGVVLLSLIISLAIMEVTEQTVFGLPNPYFTEVLALPITVSGILFSAAGVGLIWASSSPLLSKKKKIKYAKCFDCNRALSPNVQQVKLAKNSSEGYEQQIQLCRDCI